MNSRTVSRLSFIDIVAWLFIFLWIYAAANKLLDVQTFRVKLGQSPLLMPFASFVAWFIPLSEVGLAVGLAFSSLRRAALYGSFALMVMFTAYIIAITRFSDYIPCSCGGILENMSWNQHLIFNCCFVVLGAIGIIAHDKNILLQQIRSSRKPV